MEDLIFDRNQNDVIYALNNQNSTEFLKGAYNYTDLNRVEEWCEYLANLLNEYSYTVNITVKTDWSMSNFPTEIEMERIRSNVNTLKTAYYSFTSIPENLDYMTYQKANDIEKILDEIEKILSYMENNFIYSGVGVCGQSRLWQKRFRTRKDWLQFMDRTLDDYLITDTINMIATNDDEVLENKTSILELAQVDKRDDVYASIQAIDNSMEILDGLVGA